VPEESVLASMAIDVRIDKIVREYFTAQSLKILPQAPFSDAVSQYVEKDDKHAMEIFVNESLSGQVKAMLELEDEEEDLDSVMERIREIQEEGFKSGAIKRARNRAKYKPRPEHWDSDLDGEWEDQPGALILSDLDEREDETPAAPARRGRVVISDEEESVMAPPAKKVAAKRAPAKKASAKTAKASAKKAPAKAPAKGRKTATPALSDDEDADLIMMDAEPSKPPPRRAAAARSTGRQTQLNFSQQPRSQARELSDDVISDDDDDAFEPMPASSSRRR
jgi:double-strand break repair protein MRE11